MKEIKNAIEKRRSCYNISAKSPISDSELKELIDFAVLHVPSVFNSQSTRTVLLLNSHHKKLWEIVKAELQKLTTPEAFENTKAKIDGAFEAGYGTILFYEDQRTVRGLQEQFPSYQANFPVWSEHTSAMHQLAVWLLLEDAGFGASLQHYNPLIDAAVAKTWNIPAEWKLVAEMPFGTPTAEFGQKEFDSLEERSLIFE
ncbi:MAG: nitroreductase family protein [Tannerella sp.]|jgi:predicted oxidoreductase (fatty acid repression mutant protein)|nr:nitroreductase family protein [Tannerella sp.]